MSKKEFFPPQPLFEAGFSGLKDCQDFFIPNPVYPKIL